MCRVMAYVIIMQTQYLTRFAKWWQYDIFIAHFRLSAGEKGGLTSSYLLLFRSSLQSSCWCLNINSCAFFSPSLFFFSLHLHKVYKLQEVMNKESERSALTTSTSYFCNTQNRRMGRWVDSSAFSGRSWRLLLFWIYVNSHSQAYIHTYMHVHIVAHSCWPIRWVRTLPPKGQTADLCSSAEFICQLEIAHGAGKHTYIHTYTNTYRRQVHQC